MSRSRKIAIGYALMGFALATAFMFGAARLDKSYTGDWHAVAPTWAILGFTSILSMLCWAGGVVAGAAVGDPGARVINWSAIRHGLPLGLLVVGSLVGLTGLLLWFDLGRFAFLPTLPIVVDVVTRGGKVGSAVG